MTDKDEKLFDDLDYDKRNKDYSILIPILPILAIVLTIVLGIEIFGNLFFDSIIFAVIAFIFAIFFVAMNTNTHQNIRRVEKEIKNKRKLNKKSGELKEADSLIDEIKKLKTRKFKFPKTKNYETIKIPSLTKKRIEDFSTWVNNKKDLKKILLDSDFINITCNNALSKIQEAYYSPGYLNSAKLSYKVEVFQIDISEGPINLSWDENSNDDKKFFIKLISNEFLSYMPYPLEEYVTEYQIDYGLFLKDLNIEIPDEGYEDLVSSFEVSASGGSFSGAVADSDVLYIRFLIPFQEFTFVINGNDFTFSESEKDFLITLLICSNNLKNFKKIKERI